MRGWIIRIAIIGAIAGGAFIFRDRLSSNAGELKVGDCFDVPAVTSGVRDVQHHPCTEAHTGEVFAVLTHPALKGAPVPTRDELFAYLQGNCDPAFAQYTGTNPLTQDRLDYGAFYPSKENWIDGDRGVTCYAYPLPDGVTISTSIKK